VIDPLGARNFCIVFGVAALAAAPLRAEEQRATGVVSGGHWFASARYRAESVDQDGPLRTAFASTLRTSAGFETNPDLAFGAFVEIEDVHALGAEKFNSTTNGRTQYSVVPDPDGTEVNQAWLGWHRSGFRARVGRQNIVLDNARFVGDSGFRQNQQTFDAVTLQATTPGGSRFIYDYLWQVHRPFGEDHPLGKLDLRTHLLNYSLGRLNGDRLTAYAYLVEFDEASLQSQSTQTFGASYDGSIDLGTRKILYRAEYAYQSDYADNPGNLDAWYGNVELGFRFASLWTATAGFEMLSGDGTVAFQTPLATLHKFNGSNDIFTGGVPAAGLEDRYVRVYAPLGDTRLSVAWHDYRADRGSADYGNELDAELNWRLTTHWLIGLMYANYRGETFATDTRKAWLWVQADF
jgi:alginate export protein